MSNRTSLFARLTNHRLDVVAAVVGLAIALVLFPIRFLASQVYIETIPVAVGAGCLLYLYTRRTASHSDFAYPSSFADVARLAPGLVFAGLGLLVVHAALAGRRTTAFLLFTVVVTALLLFQIVFLPEEELDARLVLAEVLSLALVVRFTALYLNPGFIGFDTWTHMYNYADAILREGSLSAISEFKYYAAPLYHLLVVATVALLDVSLRHGLFLSVGVLMVVSVVFVYTTARFFVPVKWALVAATLYAVADQVVRWGIYLIPTSMGLFFFTALVYSLARLFYTDSEQRNLALLLLFAGAIVLTHQVSAAITMVLLVSGAVAQVLVYLSQRFGVDSFQAAPTSRKTTISMIVAFALGSVFLVVVWSVTPYLEGSFLQTTLGWFFDSASSSARFLNLAGPNDGSTAAPPSLTATVANYADMLGTPLLLSVTVVGSLVAFRRSRQRQSTYTFVGGAAAMMCFGLGLPLFGVRSLLPSRWFAFMYVLLILLGVVGLNYLSRTLSRNAAVALLLVFLLVFPTVMMVSVKGTRDSPVFAEERVRYAYTEAEIEAVHTIDEIVLTNDEWLHTDHPYFTLFRRNSSFGDRTNTIPFGPNGHFLPRPITVYRTYQSDPGSEFRNPHGISTMKTPTREQICPPTMNHVYTNGEVTLCRGELAL